MGQSTEEMTAQLEEAIAGDVETSTTGEEATETASQATEKEASATEFKSSDKSKGPIPYERFAEVIGEKNTLKEQLEALESEKDELSTSLRQATELATRSREDLDVLNRIREAINAEDPRVVDSVTTLDKYLKGELEAIEEESSSPEEANERTRDLLKRTREDIEDRHADLKADLILQKADSVAEKWLEALPDEYNQQDREFVAELWTNRVDWDKVEDNPELLESELAETFQEAITRYGTPRGALLSPDDVEFVEETEAPEPPSPEQELSELLSSKNWSELKTVKTPAGKEVPTPVVGDDEFSREMAKALKIGNQS